MINRDAFINAEGDKFPGKTYVDELLKPIFNDQNQYLKESMFALHKAHVVMLCEQGLLTEEETEKILLGIVRLLESNELNSLEYQSEYEDLFFLVESKLGRIIGDNLAGKMHIARSRNDMGEGMYRYVIRNYILNVIHDISCLSEALIENAEKHVESIMPAHTHTQPAQPTTFGHYLVAIFDNLQRDCNRLWHAYETVNKSPLGAAAITTTSFSINRERVSELLGFRGLIENSYDAIGTGDYLIESAQSIISLMVNTGRWLQEFLRFASTEVGLLKVADPYVQISSIMPQKRNPVSIEHSRALASSSVGSAMTVVQMIHNTPYGDIVDTEDDLQPHLYKSYQEASRVLRLMHAVTRTMTFNSEHAAQEAKKNMITITELADVLTRDHKLSFRDAHTKASEIAHVSLEHQKELKDWGIEEVNKHLVDVELSEKEWKQIVDPEVFVKRRSVRGGPNPKETTRMIHDRKESLIKNWETYTHVKQTLQESQEYLNKQVLRYINR